MIGRPPSSTLFPSATLFGSPSSGGQPQLAEPPAEGQLAWPAQREASLAEVSRLRLVTAGSQGPPPLHGPGAVPPSGLPPEDRESTRLNSSHNQISHAVFCLK